MFCLCRSVSKNENSCTIKVADEEKWNTVTLNEPVEITRVDSGGIVFFRCGDKWGQADQGDMVMGYILHSGDVEF